MGQRHLFLIIFCCCFSLTGWGQNRLFFSQADQSSWNRGLIQQILKIYQTGDYIQTIKLLDRLEGGGGVKTTKYYWKGLCYNHLGQSQKAVENLEKAFQRGTKAEDVAYLLGQNHYSLNNLEKALQYFALSYKKKYQSIQSLYYLAHISILLDRSRQAKVYFKALLESPETTPEIRQASYLQLANLIVTLTENKFNQRPFIEKYALPLIEKGIDIDPNSEVGADLKQRKYELSNKFQLTEFDMRNGERISPRTFQLIFQQKVLQDTNVTLATDLPTTTGTKKSSILYDTFFFVSYRKLFANLFALSPEIRLTHIRYGNQSQPTVFQNDSYTIAPAIRGHYYHVLGDYNGRLGLEIESNYIARDRSQVGNRQFYGRGFNFVLSEKVNFWSRGDTNLQIKRKYYTSFNPSLTNEAFTVSLDQLIALDNDHYVSLFFQIENVRVEDDFQSTDANTFIFSYIVPELWKNISFFANGSITFLDTRAQQSIRGTEKLYSPSLRMMYKFNRHFQVGLNYNYQKNVSKDKANYGYAKHIYGLEIRGNL